MMIRISNLVTPFVLRDFVSLSSVVVWPFPAGVSCEVYLAPKEGYWPRVVDHKYPYWFLTFRREFWCWPNCWIQFECTL